MFASITLAETTFAQATPAAVSGTTGSGTNLTFQLNLIIADDAPVTATVQLVSHGRPRIKYQTIDNVRPGATPISFTNLPDGDHRWRIVAPGYAPQTHHTTIRNGVANTNALTVKLYRHRYVLLRYAFNTVGRRNLHGDEAVSGRFAVAYLGGLPYFNEDWHIWQHGDGKGEKGQIMELRFFRYGTGFGFAKPPGNVPFDDLKEAPANDSAYVTESVEAVKGLTLFCRIDGNSGKPLGYGKIIVEDITDVPPEGISLKNPPDLITATREYSPEKSAATNFVFKIHLSTVDALPAKVKVRLTSDHRPRSTSQTIENIPTGVTSLTFTNLTDGDHNWTITAPGYAGQTHFTRIRNGTADTNEINIKLFRQRYVVLRYAFNTSGNRPLQGDNVETGRLAVAHWGSLPHFGQDWIVWQLGNGRGKDENFMNLDLHRYNPEFGFAPPPEGTSFDEMKEAPENSAYACRSFRAFKGLSLFCRIHGNSGNGLGYGKILVEDITDTPPEGVKVVDVSAR